jgi:REP element-mobilizing transposase RayT
LFACSKQCETLGDSYQIKDQEGCHFITCQVVGWADVFSRKAYRDIIIESLDYCIKNKGLIVYGFVIMTNHIHLIVRSSTGTLSETSSDSPPDQF